MIRYGPVTGRYRITGRAHRPVTCLNPISKLERSKDPARRDLVLSLGTPSPETLALMVPQWLHRQTLTPPTHKPLVSYSLPSPDSPQVHPCRTSPLHLVCTRLTDQQVTVILQLYLLVVQQPYHITCEGKRLNHISTLNIDGAPITWSTH